MPREETESRYELVLQREALEAAIQATPFAQLIGAKLDLYEAGLVELSVPFSTKITQHHGFAHGAVLGFLADSACAWASASIGGDVVTAEYKVNFVGPAKGEELVGRGKVIKLGGRQITAQAEVFAVADGERTLVAVALSTIARISRR